MSLYKAGRSVIQKLASAFLNFVYPSTCPVCEAEAKSLETFPICAACFDEIIAYDGPRCALCGEPFYADEAHTCGQCMASPPPVLGTICFGIYDGALREAIHQLKYSAQRRLAAPLSSLMAALLARPLRELPGGEVSLIVPVPSGAKGLRARGFSHTHLIARGFSKALKAGWGMALPVDAGLLIKHKDTPPQVGLPRAQRFENLKGAFKTRRRLSGQRILLLDDVVTTGATVRECAKTLMKAGAGGVFAAALARTVNL